VVTRFDRDTSVEPLGDGKYRARLDAGWWVGAGPNGGYIGAILIRACEHSVGDDRRLCRSFTTHFLSRASEGDIEVQVVIERSGRSMTSVSARMLQGDRVIAACLGAYSTGRDGPSFADLEMPIVPGPDEIEEPGFDDRLPESAIPEIAKRFEQRRAIGPRPFTGGTEARVGGWIRLPEPQPVDAAVLVGFADAWMPAMFSRVSGPWGITTVDLTVHVRALPAPDHDGWCLVRFGSAASQDGFCEEDGVIWSSDGTLLAHTRQLMALLPMS
jgi:acyl-CoA thioesterase